MTHPSAEQLQRFYDGELISDQSQLVQTHLRECVPCALYVSQLGGLSQMLRSVDLPDFSAGARQRTLNAMAAVRSDRGLRHLGEWAIGVAAVMIVGLTILPGRKSAIVQQTPSTESVDVGYIDTVAVMPPTTHAGTNRQLVQFAQWMAGDVSASTTR